MESASQVSSTRYVTLTVAITCLHLLRSVAGHGFVHHPTPRQVCNEIRGTIDSGGNGSGQMSDAHNGNTDHTAGTPSLCGDPFLMWEWIPGGSNYGHRPCEPQITYQQGQVITIETRQTAPHGGFYEFAICDQKDLTQECFDRNKLKSAEYDMEQWYLMGSRYSWDNGGNHYDDPIQFWTHMKLPDHLHCEHCVLMWTWWAGHICGFECESWYCGAYADGVNEMVYPDWKHWGWKLPKCQNGKYPPRGVQPQIFRNCMDIRIKPHWGRKLASDEETDFDVSIPLEVAEMVGAQIAIEVAEEEASVVHLEAGKAYQSLHHDQPDVYDTPTEVSPTISTLTEEKGDRVMP